MWPPVLILALSLLLTLSSEVPGSDFDIHHHGDANAINEQRAVTVGRALAAAESKVGAKKSLGQILWKGLNDVPWKHCIIAVFIALLVLPLICFAFLLVALVCNSTKTVATQTSSNDIELGQMSTRSEARELAVPIATSSAPVGNIQLVQSPFSSEYRDDPRLTSTILQLFRFCKLCMPSLWSEAGGWLLKLVVLLSLLSVYESAEIIVLVVQIKLAVIEGDKSSFFWLVVLVMIYNATFSFGRALANYCSMRAMITCRLNLVGKLHKLYTSKSGRLYYTLGNLDQTLDNPDSRMTNDVDLLLQWLFEFFFGGICKPDSGMLYNTLLLFVVMGTVVATAADKKVNPMFGPASAFGYLFLLSLLSALSGPGVRHYQRIIQSREAFFRNSHANCRLLAESICFYGGEDTEMRRISQAFTPIRDAWSRYTFRKFWLDLIQLVGYHAYRPFALVIAVMAVRSGKYAEFKALKKQLTAAEESCQKGFRAISYMVKASLDLIRATATLSRVIQLVEVMEMYESFSFDAQREVSRVVNDTCMTAFGFTYYAVPKLTCSTLADVSDSTGIDFNNIDVFTPDGKRLLLTDVDLKLSVGESCLIMGPSGIGKSSLIRVLGQLWPLFLHPKKDARSAYITRPSANSIFFMAQKPYLCKGSLREQVAYPIWEASVLDELTDSCMAQLFEETNLQDVWKAYQSDADDQSVNWSDVLSLGEQQRLQFCRLFWHHSWHKKRNERAYADGHGFFAILDESTAALDTESEMRVYLACRQRSLGFLSVAHRPTVVQFHSSVIQFEVKRGRQVEYATRSAKDVAQGIAEQLAAATEGNRDLVGTSARRSFVEPSARRSLPVAEASTRRSRKSKLIPNSEPAVGPSPDSADIGATPLSTPNTFNQADSKLPASSHADVVTPYSSTLEEETVLGFIGNFVRWVLIGHANTMYVWALLVCTVVLKLTCSYQWSLFTETRAAFLQERVLWTNAEPGAYQRAVSWLPVYGILLALQNTVANFTGMLMMIEWRTRCVEALNRMYFDKRGKLYYKLNNLDGRVDFPDQRISNDCDLMHQLLYEFFLGGVQLPEFGLLYLFSGFIFTIFVMIRSAKEKTDGTWYYLVLPGITPFVYFVLTVPPGYYLGHWVSDAQQRVQALEANFRAAHARVRLYAESICFFGGEGSEEAYLNHSMELVSMQFQNYAFRKFFLEWLAIFFLTGAITLAMVTGGGIALFVVGSFNPSDSVDVLKDKSGRRDQLYEVMYMGLYMTIMNLVSVNKSFVDLSRGTACLYRVSKLYEVMQAFLKNALVETEESLKQRFPPQLVQEHLSAALEEMRIIDPMFKRQYIGCCIRYNVKELPVPILVPRTHAAGVLFEKVDVYTPNGQRLLLENVSLRLASGQSCLIMGPSGVGKSSLLRVLGGLWPLFRSRIGADARFHRPGDLNMFFLAQKPYLCEGTLREQVAYPVWDKSLLQDLGDENMERLFKEAGLEDVWEARRGDMDAENISWADVLSLGEQQRLQFCRLFWHHDWHTKYRTDNDGFFAVLDESSASMDMESEMKVYKSCCERKLGFLSVAHRPTVIQYHSKVLILKVDDANQVQYEEKDADKLAVEVAGMITKHLSLSLQK